MRRWAEGEPELAQLLEEAVPGLWGTMERLQAIPMEGDGSDRKFFRIRQGPRRMVAVLSPRKVGLGVDENDSYFLIGHHLKSRGVPVPRFFWGDSQKGRFLLEDVGDCHFQVFALRGIVDLSRLYDGALAVLAHLHQHAPEGFDAGFCFDTPVYDPSFVYSRELEYFRNSFLNDLLELEVSEEDLRRDFEDLAAAAGTGERRWVIHRDFQSRNLMIFRGRIRLLDFQGMRYGPPAYDLASLMLDPYVGLPGGVQGKLVRQYWRRVHRFLGGTECRFWERYQAVRLSRNLQALAAYGYLGKMKGKRRFLGFIPRAWSRLMDWIQGPCRGRYPRLQCCLERIEKKGILRKSQLLRDT